MYVYDGHIFNMMDTNGRRADFADAMSIYLRCLNETYQEQGSTKWAPFPTSATQFVFYQKAVSSSPDTLKKHEAYDKIMQILQSHNALDNFLSCDKAAVDSAVSSNKTDYEYLYGNLSVNVESRARHYTTNLAKIGFVTKKRQITEIGKALLKEVQIQRDDLERALPIDDINLIYFRQILKLRIFTYGDSKKFLSPIPATIYMLIKYKRVSRTDFANIIQTLSPYHPIQDFDKYLSNYFKKKKQPEAEDETEIPDEFLTDEELDDDILRRYFVNGKTKASVDIYIKFYHRLYAFVANQTQDALEAMLDCWNQDKAVLNRAFGYGKNIFKTIKSKKVIGNKVDAFIDKNLNVPFLQDIDGFNEELYQRFQNSKAKDNRREYADTTIRLMRMSGIFKYENGLIELAYPEIFEEIFKYVNIDEYVFGEVNPKDMEQENRYFESNATVLDILGLKDKADAILTNIGAIYGTDDPDKICEKLKQKNDQEFRKFIKKEFPKERTIQILEMFHDRKAGGKVDNQIKKAVNEMASVPTIFEYIVGIAWYYLSDENFDISASLKMSLDANFRPTQSAPGNDGDIIIDYGKYVVMIEVTLMNTQAQKRGEWEPVLRHSVNNKAKYTTRYAVTFFIADELDLNTINIWRAVSTAPLETTDGSKKPVSDVRIMPISIEELREFLEKDVPAALLIDCAEDSYEDLKNGKSPMNTTWRDDYMHAIMDRLISSS